MTIPTEPVGPVPGPTGPQPIPTPNPGPPIDPPGEPQPIPGPGPIEASSTDWVAVGFPCSRGKPALTTGSFSW